MEGSALPHRRAPGRNDAKQRLTMSVLVAMRLHVRRVLFADARFLSWIAGPAYQWSTSWETARESVASDAGIEVDL